MTNTADLPTLQPTLSRRSIVAGSAWAVPALAVAAAAPAMATSQETLTLDGYFNVVADEVWYTAGTLGGSGTSDGSAAMRVYSNSNGPNPAIYVYDTSTASTITDVTVTFFLIFDELSFTLSETYSNTNWSSLDRDTSRDAALNSEAAPTLTAGASYYAYTTTYTGAITATSGYTTIPALAFTTADGALTSDQITAWSGNKIYAVLVSAVLNGITTEYWYSTGGTISIG